MKDINEMSDEELEAYFSGESLEDTKSHDTSRESLEDTKSHDTSRELLEDTKSHDTSALIGKGKLVEWEYTGIPYPPLLTALDIAKLCNELGRYGWELVVASPRNHLLFKRPKV